jgi:hypothetical protein
MKGLIYNNSSLSLKDATTEQIEASKRWYFEKIKEYRKESDFYEMLKFFQDKLKTLNTELSKRKK